MKRLKINIIILFSMFFIIIFSNFINNNAEPININNKPNLGEEEIEYLPPSPSSGIKNYEYNLFLLVREYFSGDLENWTIVDPGDGATAQIAGGKLDFRADGDSGTFPNFDYESISAEYSEKIDPMEFCYISFNYEGFDADAELWLDLYYGGSWNNNKWSISGDTGGEIFKNITLSSSEVKHDDFSFRFRFRGRQYKNPNEDRFTVDNLKIKTFQFNWQEKAGDLIEPDQDQTISTFITSDINFDRSNVSLKYYATEEEGVYDVDDLGTKITADEPSSITTNFSFLISSDNYDSSHVIYYQIATYNKTFHRRDVTPTMSFRCEDREGPSITSIVNNASQYYNDVNISCHIEDNVNGVGLKNATLYVRNGTEPFKEDEDGYTKLILSDKNAAIPNEGGKFDFIIPSKYLSAQSTKQLHCKIYSEDDNGNFANSAEFSLTITDDRAPWIIFNANNTDSQNRIDANQDLKVCFNITEPRGAIGIKNASMYVKIGNSAPTSGSDHDFGPIQQDGELNRFASEINFTFSKLKYEGGKNIYFWINTSDYSGNRNSTLKYNRTVSLKDITGPNVLDYNSNDDPINYDAFKTLKFDLDEPPGGVGIDNDTIKIYYEVSSKFESSPKVQDTSDFDPINRYQGTITAILDDLDYKTDDIVYYQIKVNDTLDNNYTSAIKSFSIVDITSPTHTESGINTNGWIYGTTKQLTFSCSDPGYSKSSGIARIFLYYKAGEAPTTNIYDGKSNKTIGPSNASVTFTPSFDTEDYEEGPEIYYFTELLDGKGNKFTSEVKNFTLYQTAYKPGTIIKPNEFIATTDFTVSCDLNFYCNVWYSDNYSYTKTGFSNVNSFEKSFSLVEGYHRMGLHFMDNLSTYWFDVTVDLTAPEPITDISYELVAGSVVQLSWKPPVGADTNTTYKIYRSTISSFTVGQETLIATVQPGKALYFEDADLKVESSYYYKILSIDRVGHLSEPSTALKVDIPTQLWAIILIPAVIGGAIITSGLVVVKKVKASKTQKMLDKIDMNEVEVKYKVQEPEPTKEVKWDKVEAKRIKKQKPPSKPESKSGIQFEKTLPLGSYLKKTVGTLVSREAVYELNDDMASALTVNSILLRMSKRMNNSTLITRAHAKREQIINSLPN